MKPKKPAKLQPSPAQRMAAQVEVAAELLKALSNAQRLRVLCLLADGELTVGELNARVELSQSALSQHLAVLREHQMVNTRRESQTIYYSIAEGPVQKVINTLHAIYCPLE